MVQLKRIQRLRERGFSTGEIASVLETSAADIEWYERRGAQDGYLKLQTLAKRLLKHVPHWWPGTERSWRHCIWMNFCDVLPEKFKSAESRATSEANQH